jgi:NADH-quinone oxidoreductase subunit J
VLFGFALTYSLIYKNDFQSSDKPFDWSVNKIGSHMLETGEHGYALPFEVVSILLLAAMIGCIVIALKAPSDSPKGEK